MRLVDKKISLGELEKMAKESFGEMVKAVVDIEKQVMAVDGELHADEEAYLLERGSFQENLWGVNIYPELPEDEWIEFDSMINLRPGRNNSSRGVESKETRKKIIEIVNELVER